ncbi:MAG TPA: hypothetical protein VGB74_00665 [Actinoplanes sp.]|jgi:hypothetical protein
MKASLASAAVGGLQGHSALYLIPAGICLLVALRYVRRALSQLGPVLHAIVATAVVALSIGAALALLAAALLSR